MTASLPNMGMRGWLASAVAGVAAAGLSAGTSKAMDWSVIVTATERASVNDNPGLEADKSEGAITSGSSLSVATTGQTRSSKVDLQAGVSYQKPWGWYGYEASDSLFPNLSAAYEKRGKRTTFRANLSYALEDVTDTELADTATEDRSGTRQTIRAAASINHRLGPRNTLNLDARHTTISYIDQGAGDTPSSAYGTSLSWVHNATRRVDFTTSASADWTLYDDATDSLKGLYSLRSSVAVKVNKRLKVSAGTGVQLLDSYADDLLAAGTPRRRDTTPGWTANANFDYAMRAATITGSLNYGLNPTTDGDLQTSLVAALSARYRINDRSNIGVNARLYMADTEGGADFDETSFSIGPTYSRELTRWWSMQAGYQFVIADTGEGSAIQNSAFVSFTRKFEYRP